jgi:hypothetical protein
MPDARTVAALFVYNGCAICYPNVVEFKSSKEPLTVFLLNKGLGMICTCKETLDTLVSSPNKGLPLGSKCIVIGINTSDASGLVNGGAW